MPWRNAESRSFSVTVFPLTVRFPDGLFPYGLFPLPSVSAGRLRRVVELSINHRPILAKQVATCLGCQIQTVAVERVSGGAVAVRPIDIGQAFRHQRPGQPGPVGNITPLIVASDEDPL